MGATETRKQPAEVDYDIDDDSLYTTRNPSSARRYQQPVEHDTIDDPLPQRGPITRRRASIVSNAPNASNTIHKLQSKPLARPAMPTMPAIKLGQKRLPLLAVVVGMFVMALLVLGFSTVSAWWQVHLDDTQYGRPRTFQMDAVVGHQDSASNPTHFIFINLNRHVEIIELPGGDSAHARIYAGPILYGDGQDLTPITGEIRDVNGDGKPDLIVHIQDQQIVFINDGTQFRPLQPGEQIHL
ncbi:MAG: hypothetical protein ABI465_14255 [Ktedonobacteraceae bacterium]